MSAERTQFTDQLIYFAIPAKGRGPSFGPVMERAVAERNALAMPGYVVGIQIAYRQLLGSGWPQDPSYPPVETDNNVDGPTS